MKSVFKWSLAVIFSVAAVIAQAADKPYYYIPDVPEDLEKVDFYLLTVGVGDELAARYGHTGIRVVNHVDKTDVVFNWGKFYFDSPLFAVNFYRGDLTYSMGVRTYRGDVEHHVEDSRRMVQEQINLNSKQKRKLLEKIAWNAKPENRDFKYQYWFKNCSTIPRDYLDEVLEGQVRAKYYSEHSGKTFRDYVRSNLSMTPMMIPVLDTIMNSKIDREMTQWEEMFLPEKLRQYLMGMNAVDLEGNPLVGKPLLTGSTVITDLPENYRDFRIDYFILSGSLILFFVLAAVSVFRTVKAGPAKYKFIGAGLMVFGLVGGILGPLMLLNWLFSGHPDIWHNANLMLFTPMDGLFAIVGFQMLRTRAAVKDRIPFQRAGESLAWLHIASFVILLATVLYGFVLQDVKWPLLVGGVPGVFLSILLIRFGLHKFEPVTSRQNQVTESGKSRKEKRSEGKSAKPAVS